jgi:hypothetical protein
MLSGPNAFSCHVFAAPVWDNVVGCLLPLRGLSSLNGLLLFERQRTPPWDVFVQMWDVLFKYGAPARVSLMMVLHIPECQGLAFGEETL